MQTIDFKKLIFVEVGQNSNKVWEIHLHADDTVQTNWGRVGKTLQSATFTGGRRTFDKKVSEKLKKGYTELQTVDVQRSGNDGDLKKIAKKQIRYSTPESEKLIERLVESNIHQITSDTLIKFDSHSGLFSTPLGIVTLENITRAREILAEIYENFGGNNLDRQLGHYLRLIPHEVGRKLSVESVFPTVESLEKESQTLDALESSQKIALETPKEDGVEAKIFDISLDTELKTSKDYLRLEEWFHSSKQPAHGYNRCQIEKIYKITHNLPFVDIGDTEEMFHGTTQGNLLSILKNGIKIAPPSGAHISGKLYGCGVYGAKCSTKSLGYSFGRWGGKRNDKGWLLICDFSMGKSYYPKGGFSRLPDSYDSCRALAQNTSLRNDEFVVYKETQIKIKYLLEIKP